MDSHPESLLPGATRTLAEFAADVQFDAIPAEVIARMKTSFRQCWLLPVWCHAPLDSAGSGDDRRGGRATGRLHFRYGSQTSVAGAVLVNATAGHAFELDDIHKESILHAGSIATPVVVNLVK